MTTATAGTSAESDKNKDGGQSKEKPGMRRALGRGLASLLPGPRVVSPVAPAAGREPSAPSTAGPADRISDAARGGEAVPAPRPSGESSTVAESRQPGAAVSTSTGIAISASTGPAAVPGSGRTVPMSSAASVSLDAVAEDTDAVPEGPIELMGMAAARPRGNLVVAVAIADIDKNPFQTRQVEDDEALEELANSIKVNGVIQPIVVRPSDEEEGRYVLILGERRMHASKKAGLTHIPAIVRKVSQQQAAEMTIVENLQREDLLPLEQAQAFRVLSTQFNLTQQEIAERVGLSRVSVANYMRLLKLPRDVMDMLATKVINFAQAKELLKLEDNDRISEAALYAVKKGMSVEQIEMLILRMEGLADPIPGMPGAQKKERVGGGARWVDPNVRAAQYDLERLLGVRVRIRDRKGKGKIVIEYSTVDDYERVVEMLRARK